MKLYTEEQVMEAYHIGTEDSNCGRYRENANALKLTPIELPSNEDIEYQSIYIAHNYFDMHNTNHYQGLKEGAKEMAKWMKEQILKQIES